MGKNKNKNKNNFNNTYKRVLFKDGITNLKRDFKVAIDEMSDSEFIELFSLYLSCLDVPSHPDFIDDYDDDYETFTIEDEELPF